MGGWGAEIGDYGQTLGFNNKLTLGENASITFNIIYARRDLGSNHLHIGFYPKTGTATLGEEDGLRVDFWFSTAGNFEISCCPWLCPPRLPRVSDEVFPAV